MTPIDYWQQKRQTEREENRRTMLLMLQGAKAAIEELAAEDPSNTFYPQVLVNCEASILRLENSGTT